MSYDLNPHIPANWAEETLFQEGDSFFEDLCRAITRAKDSIVLETYIFDQDSIGKKILNLLHEAAQRGVKVQVLLDGVGCSQWNAQDAKQVRRSGVELRFFHPLPWQKKDRKYWHWWSLRVITRGFYKLNHRNHRKICIIDSDVAYIGSLNVSDRHLDSISGKSAWRDTGLKLRGTGVAEFLHISRQIWNNSVHTRKLIQHEKRTVYRKLRNDLSQAKERIWITNPYFVPAHGIKKTLIQAAKNGLDVRLLVQGKSDFFGVKYAMQSYYTSLLSAGARIYEYQPSILHAKTMILDQNYTVGSSNFDHRSLLLDLEVNVAVKNNKNKKNLEERFLADLTHSVEINGETWKGRPWNQRILERIFYSFRKVL